MTNHHGNTVLETHKFGGGLVLGTLGDGRVPVVHNIDISVLRVHERDQTHMEQRNWIGLGKTGVVHG